MRLKIENFLAINKADIKLDGITVVAGQNDSGKSTVAKFLFGVLYSSMSNHLEKEFCSYKILPLVF